MERNRDALPEYLFGEGTNFQAYQYFGAHRSGDGEVVFRVWAPRADAVSLVGDFNGWNTQSHPLMRWDETGVWTGVLKDPYFRDGSKYKYAVTKDGRTVLKADPFAFWSENRSETASLFLEESGRYEWQDAEYMENRKQLAGPLLSDCSPSVPMNIYEVHLGSWKRTLDGNYLTYDDFARDLTEYVLDMGYTHVELLPVMEHPLDASWGYQVCGYYAPTSRFGTPGAFKYLVDTLHRNGIGVILDWVPAHFPKDAHGLYMFDGTPTYEYEDPRKMGHPSWGTHCFDLGKTQVQSFLISNAMYWLDEYHIDGLRVDAVASMLYLDFDRGPGQWAPNDEGGNINKEAVWFLQKMNRAVKERHPDCLTIAEESTSYANVTKQYGLGFNMKWCMGWMNDTLSYLPVDPLFRRYVHGKLTFSLVYVFGESYVLPVSHDEVVHLKRSLLNKSFGGYEQRFAGTRAFLTYMMTHPGKKLLFMGCDFGQFDEWNEAKSLDWHLLGYPMHEKLHDYVRDLNRVYRAHLALWDREQSWDGFRWALADDASQNVLAYERMSSTGEVLLVCVNFSGSDYWDYEIPVANDGWYRPLLQSDDPRYGGRGVTAQDVHSFERPDCGYRIKATLPALGAVIFRLEN
ncbi:MAG: 1,4-alpha-glucan branching protein GlgB [Clostridia bacterium]|nr:1,4-alpha-glucan branching protein GlgB [Clostridia bacterium]